MMIPRKQSRIGDPEIYKRLVKQLADSASDASRVDKEMDRFVSGSDRSRWRLMKRKYTVPSSSLSRRSSDLQLNPELIMRVQVRQRSKEPGCTSLASIIKNPSQRVTRKRGQEKDMKFFNGDKKSIRYFQQESISFLKLKTDECESKKQSRNNWYNTDKVRGRKRQRGSRVQHPVIDLYRSTMADVMECCRSRQELKSPFDWFASPYELDDF